MKNKIFKLLIFIAVWFLFYWLINLNFVFVSFLFAYVFTYHVGKDTLVFLAKEFDKNHNLLAENVKDLREDLDRFSIENEQLRYELETLKREISDSKTD